MGKMYYVNGNILIRTRDFKYHVEDGCLYQIPDNANVLEPNENVDGSPCFVLDDKNSFSIFDTFRASGGFSSDTSGSYYYNSSYQEVYENYISQRKELADFIDIISDNCNFNKSYAYKLIFMNIMTLFDAFVCELYISKLTSDEDLFGKELASFKKNKSKYKDYMEEYGPNEERAFVYYKREQSYINYKKINKIIKEISCCPENLISEDSAINCWIKLRHDVAHNNAREEDGEFHCFTKEEILNALDGVDFLIGKIMDIVRVDDGK